MGSLEALKMFEILDRGKGPPKGYQMIPMWIIFDVKMNLTRKARLVAGGHVTKLQYTTATAALHHDKAFDLPSWQRR